MKPSEERESAFARHFCAAARIEGFVADINDDNRGLITAIMRIDNGKPCSYGITAFVDLGHLYESTIEQAGHYGEWLARETIKNLRRDLAKGSNKMTPLATIKEPGLDGRTALYWREGSIWSREPDGMEWSNSVAPCCLRDAIKVIRAVWGEGYDLLFRNTTWIEMISGIIQGYDLEADPVAVRAEMEKYYDLDKLLCADFIDAVRQAAGDAPIGYSLEEIPE